MYLLSIFFTKIVALKKYSTAGKMALALFQFSFQQKDISQSVVAIVATQFNAFRSTSHQVRVSGFIFLYLEF